MTTHHEECERTLATAPFAEIYGFVLVSIEDDSCTLRIPFRPLLERPGGIIAGPVYMAAADVSKLLGVLQIGTGGIVAGVPEPNSGTLRFCALAIIVFVAERGIRSNDCPVPRKVRG